MNGNSKLVYWDTCIFLSWLTNEKRDEREIRGIEEQVPIHLATAIKYECVCFYTFDGKDKKGNSRSLLPLNGSIAENYFLRIEKPGYGQLL